MRDDLWRLLGALSPFDFEVDLALVESALRLGERDLAGAVPATQAASAAEAMLDGTARRVALRPIS